MSSEAQGPQPTAHDEGGCSRRDAMRLLAASAAITAGAGAVSADDDDDFTDPRYLSPSYRARSGFASLIADAWSDPAPPTQTNIRAEYHADATEMELAQNGQFEDIENQFAMLRDFIRQNVVFDVAEELRLDEVERSEVIETSEDAVDDQVASLQKSILNMWELYWQMTLRRLLLTSVEEFETEGEVRWPDVFEAGGTGSTTGFGSGVSYGMETTDYGHIDDDSWAGEPRIEAIRSYTSLVHTYAELPDDHSVTSDWIENVYDPIIDDDAYEGGDNVTEYQVDLVNGEGYPVTLFVSNDGFHSESSYNGFYNLFVPTSDQSGPSPGSEYSSGDTDFSSDTDPIEFIDGEGESIHDYSYMTEIRVLPPDTGMSTSTLIDAADYIYLWDDLMTLRDEEIDHAVTMAETFYDGVQDGTVDPDEIEVSSPQRLLDQAMDPEDYGEQAAVYRAGNYPEAEEPATIELSNGITLEGILFWTLADDDGLEVGETIDPEDTPGGIHISAEVTNVPDDAESATLDPDEVEEGDLVAIQIHEEFEIVHTSGDNDTLHFDVREVADPEMDAEEIRDTLHETYKAELRAELEDEYGDSGDDDSIGFPSFGGLGPDAEGLLGIGIIAVVVMAVVGIVTDLVPGLGN